MPTRLFFLNGFRAAGPAEHPALRRSSASRRKPLRDGLAVLAVLVLASSAPGQIEDVAADAAPPPDHASKDADTPADVYLNDSLEAADAIAKALELADEGKWDEAVVLLQRTSATSGDKLTRVAGGHYVGLRRYIADLICALPDEGLAAYRSRYENELLAALSAASEAHNTRRLLILLDRYFCTATAAALAGTIGQLAIESGDLALAKMVYKRVLNHHPDGPAYSRDYGALLAIIAAIRGEDLPEVDAPLDDTRIRWKGGDRTLGEVIEAVRSQFERSAPGENSASWPMFGGGPGRNRLGPEALDELGLLWRCKDLRQSVPDKQFAGRPHSPEDERERESWPAMHAVVGAELLYVQRYRDIAAINRNTGVVAWSFRADPPPTRDSPDGEREPGGWHSVTVFDDRIYAALPGDNVPYYGLESSQSPPELVSLDAFTGELLWRIDSTDLVGPAPSGSKVSFDSSPVVTRGAMYVVARRRRSFGFEDCYLCSLDPANGRLLFQTHLGSASTGTFGSHRPTMAMVTLREDTAYVCTNLGCVAAVDAHLGSVRWVRQYERFGQERLAEPVWAGRDPKAPNVNPLLFSRNRLILLPTDSARVFVLDADDGTVAGTFDVSALGGVVVLLGAHGRRLCGVGDRVACFDLDAGNQIWSADLDAGRAPYGRGVWAGENLLIPTRNGLVSFNAADGRRAHVPWDTEGTGGNLLAIPKQLLVAERDAIVAYVSKEELWGALRARMSADPDDPLPALELAEVALRGGEIAEALEVLEEAVKRAGGLLESVEPALKRRFFNDALMFAQVLSDGTVLNHELLDRLFTLASRSPPDAQAHVRYRMAFAEIHVRHRQPDRALRLYQQVLRDRTLRDLEIAGTEGLTQTAAALAQSRIAEIVEQNGASIYAPYDAEAKRWLDSARQSRDRALLERLVDTFPNSGAAPQALVALADLMSQGARPSEAARLFARAYHRYPSLVNRPKLMRRIADSYELAGQPENAYRWLTKAAREHPGATTLHEGRALGFLEYRKRLAHVRGRVVPEPPTLDLPLARRQERELGESAVLLRPVFADHPAARWRAYFVLDDRSVHALDPVSNRELWDDPVSVRTNAELLIATSQVAVFTTQYTLFGCDLRTGEIRWTYGSYPEEADEALGDWEDGAGFRTHALRDDQLVSVRENGEVSSVSISTGEVLWSRTHRPVPAGPVRIGDLWIVYHVVQDGSVLLCRLDAATGAWADATQTREERAVADLFVALDAQVVLATAMSLAGYDLESGAKRWEVALRGHVRPGSLLLDVDALYVSDDGRVLKKVNLEDGRILWESERLAHRDNDDMTAYIKEGSVIITTSSSVGAVDTVSGVTLWQGTTPDRPSFTQRLLTSAYVAALHAPQQPGEDENTVYFYDHRNASGLIPRDGGMLQLGKIADLRAVLATDGALIIQDGSKVVSWTGTPPAQPHDETDTMNK